MILPSSLQSFSRGSDIVRLTLLVAWRMDAQVDCSHIADFARILSGFRLHLDLLVFAQMDYGRPRTESSHRSTFKKDV